MYFFEIIFFLLSFRTATRREVVAGAVFEAAPVGLALRGAS